MGTHGRPALRCTAINIHSIFLDAWSSETAIDRIAQLMSPSAPSLASIGDRARLLLLPELVEHAHESLIYISAISWTHVFLPALGGPVLLSMPEILYHKFRGPYLVFVWLYVACMTSVCYWWFNKAHAAAKEIRRSAGETQPYDPRNLTATFWDNSSKAMAWIAVYAWTVATLGTLPTFTPVQAVLSALGMTAGMAGALLLGQHGRGPFAKALMTQETDALRWTIFFAAWMTVRVAYGCAAQPLSCLSVHSSSFYASACCKPYLVRTPPA